MCNPNQLYSDVKEKIINQTISLIENSDGLVESITIRDIAQKADVAVGLINYHFGSKMDLIEICVQRIISHVMRTFPGKNSGTDVHDVDDADGESIASFTTRVFSFLIQNPEISKISMLGDLSHPSSTSNSSVSYRAIVNAISDTESEKIEKIKAFMLLSTIQSAFLNRCISGELLGIDLNDKSAYRIFFQIVTDILDIQ
ncbi:MAG: TetR/AcrR family transcriptional regulator [Clostridiaceae bacterium]|nr:TetR/AcrR family transcriptional regulator [Clostridiaceae bacterium]